MAAHVTEYEARGIRVLPVLAQDAQAVRRYVEKVGLPFDILIDADRAVSKSYGVWHRIGLVTWNVARPAVFLLDQGGTIRRVFVATRQTEYPTHQEILAWLEG